MGGAKGCQGTVYSGQRSSWTTSENLARMSSHCALVGAPSIAAPKPSSQALNSEIVIISPLQQLPRIRHPRLHFPIVQPRHVERTASRADCVGVALWGIGASDRRACPARPFPSAPHATEPCVHRHPVSSSRASSGRLNCANGTFAHRPGDRLMARMRPVPLSIFTYRSTRGLRTWTRSRFKAFAFIPFHPVFAPKHQI